MDHKQLMAAVIALAVVHLVLSAIVGYLAYNEKLSPMHIAGFCGVSVVVNIVILSLAAKCRSMSVSA